MSLFLLAIFVDFLVYIISFYISFLSFLLLTIKFSNRIIKCWCPFRIKYAMTFFKNKRYKKEATRFVWLLMKFKIIISSSEKNTFFNQTSLTKFSAPSLYQNKHPSANTPTHTYSYRPTHTHTHIPRKTWLFFKNESSLVNYKREF